MDYYAILKLPRTASQLDILNAFKQHILYTEDRDSMGEAFEVLSSTFKDVYDAYGYGILHHGVPEQGPFKGFKAFKYHGETDKLIEMVFGCGIDFAKQTDMLTSIDPPKIRIVKLKPTYIHLDVTLEEAYTGCTKIVEFTKKEFKETRVDEIKVELSVIVPKAVLSGYQVIYKDAGDILPFTIPSILFFI